MPDLTEAKQYTVGELKRGGHQPCRWIGHYQGTDCEEWRCPQCGSEYVCSVQPYCHKCMESNEAMKKRLEDKKKELKRMEESIPDLKDDIAILEKLLSS